MYKLTDEQIAEVRKKYPPKRTNLEKIRAMSDEELAEFIYEMTKVCFDGNCTICSIHRLKHDCYELTDVFDWLKAEVEE